MVKTQHASYFKRIRSDDALKFLKSECNSLFLSQGIIHEISYAYIPQKICIVERSIDIL